MFLSRRQFLKVSAGTVAAVAVADKVLALTALQPVIEVGNPLGDYPDRSWERVYHDQYRYDSSFTWCCSPNDTHACRIRAFVRNGVVMRVEQNYDHQTYEDLYGNRGTFAHNPRMCLKGFTFHRRVYGPYRLKGPLMRKGWKAWMDDGSPELTPDTKRKYKFDSRFLDDMLRVSWDTAFTYAAKAYIIIATRYSGEAGARRLREQGYAPEMIEMMKGAGTRCFKHRAGMPVLGICRGFQLLNIHYGGTLEQHLDDVVDGDLHRVKLGEWSNHPVEVLGGKLQALVPSGTVIHSHHHQGVDVIGGGLEVTAKAPDDTVEGLEDPAKRFAVGVLWHPEEAHTDSGAPIFRALIEAAAEYAARRS